MNESWWFREKDDLNVISQAIHTTIGYTGIFFNGFILFVVLRCQPHIQVLLGFLAVGDLCICLEEIGDSSLRLLAMLETDQGKPYFHGAKVPRIMCLWTLTSHMGFIQTALQQPATVAIALERCFAVFKPLLIAALNLWYDGSKMQNGVNKAISYLVDRNPDIVLLQEVWNSATSVKISEGLSTAFGEEWSVCGDDALRHSTRIISRLPIHTRLSHNLHRSIDATNCVLSSDGLFLDTWSIHLDHNDNGPYALCLGYYGCNLTHPIQKCEAKVLRMEDRRRSEIEKIIAAQKKNQPSDFVIFGGDFNAPSHLDYTEATREAHCGAVVRWPVSVVMERAGFVDTYRSAHLDPSTHPGNTWSTVFKSGRGRNRDQPEPQDRIDFVYVKDEKSPVRVTSADIVPGPEEAALIAERYQAPDNNYGSPWPSDHFAVWSDVVAPVSQSQYNQLRSHDYVPPLVWSFNLDWQLAPSSGFTNTIIQIAKRFSASQREWTEWTERELGSGGPSIGKPLGYNAEWKNRYERQLIFGLLGYAGVIVFANYIWFIIEPDYLIDIKCSSAKLYWIELYDNYEKGIWSCVAAVLTVVAVVKGRSILRAYAAENPEMADRMRRLNRTAVIVVMTNFILVIGPAVYRQQSGVTPGMKSALYCLVLSNSIANLPVLLLTNSDFRKKSLDALKGVMKPKGDDIENRSRHELQ